MEATALTAPLTFKLPATKSLLALPSSAKNDKEKWFEVTQVQHLWQHLLCADFFLVRAITPKL